MDTVRELWVRELIIFTKTDLQQILKKIKYFFVQKMRNSRSERLLALCK